MCLQRALDKRYELSIQERGGEVEWHLDVPPDAATPALNALANALNEAGRCGPWRNEQLAVCNPEGEIIGTVERGAVRVLGITTRAVHLVGMAPDGQMWVQKRSQDKPNNPGMWDTLMGGMVSAADTLPEALARETWEEAGLRIADLTGLRQGGHVDFCRPSREGGGVGYMVERIDWFCADVPAGVEPLNQDGEVERFELWSLDTVRQQVAMDAFTLEAGLVIAGYLGV
jgi:8-oxo-dGTP pyrophosphatase MutT (NUDIX family)